MLVVPVAEKFSWKNPPFITLLLILINVMVYCGFQADDNEEWGRAIDHYFNSGLSAIEIPLYLDYRKNGETPLEFPKGENLSKEERNYFIFWEMEQDDKFQKMLADEGVVTAKSPDYSKWKMLRSEFKAMKDGIFTNRYQFIPAQHKPVTFISHMFLHGGYEHLIGNMIFLWLFGCILEIGCGRSTYLLAYTLTGLGAVSLYWAANPASETGLVGASGAISGLMGAYTVLFGKSRIKLFMYLGFYFNYIRIPAILLLPFWLVREMYALMLGPESNVAYMAHIGGIISGVLAGWLIWKFSDFRKHEVFKEEEPDRIKPLMEEALDHIGKLEFKKGKALLEQVIQEDHRNYPAYDHIYTLEKQNPGNDSFHVIAKKYLAVLCSDESMHGRIHRLYNEYRGLAKPRLSPELYIALSIVFSRNGHLEDAEEIIGMILRKKPDLPKIPTAILKLSHAFKRKKLEEKSLKYLDILCVRYPETPEAALAQKAISEQI